MAVVVFSAVQFRFQCLLILKEQAVSRHHAEVDMDEKW